MVLDSWVPKQAFPECKADVQRAPIIAFSLPHFHSHIVPFKYFLISIIVLVCAIAPWFIRGSCTTATRRGYTACCCLLRPAVLSLRSWYMVPSASCCSDVSHLEDVLPPTQSRVCRIAAVQLQRASHNITYTDK